MMDSDCGLNLKLGFDGSLQKVLMRTMVDQEDIFKNQVHELHRLYKIQKIYMKEDFTFGSGGIPHSFESLITERRPNTVHAIRCSESVENHCLIERRDTLKHQQLSLDLELASSHYTNGNENLLSLCITPEVSAFTKRGIYDDNYSSNKVLKLSLGTDENTQQRSSGRKTCNNEIICSPYLQAMHFESSTYGKNLSTIPGYACGTLDTQSRAKNEFEMRCSIRCGESDAFNWISESQSLTVGMDNFLEREQHLFQGVEQCRGDLSCKNMPSRTRPFTSHEVGELDLNKALPDETSVNPIDPQTFNSSQSASSGVSHNEIADHGQATSFTVLDFTESRALAQQEFTASTVTTSPSKDTSENICKSKLCSVGFGSVRRCLSGSKKAVNGSRSFGPENGESGISLQEKTSQRISMSNVVFEKKENKLQSYNSSQELLEGADSNRSPLSCKSDCNTDDASSNTKRECRAIGIPKSKVSPSALQYPQSSLVSKDQAEQNMTRPSETKSQCFGAEVDETVRKGAASLVYFSCLALNQDCSLEPKKRKKSCSTEREMPQSSSESYESIVLKQVDRSVDEYCVSSTPPEAMGSDKKESGVKLRRGRRMKDFRKEILPGLASLSRQEISEDIKIMELALRSREYKKYSSKAASRSDCISSVRSRRPRLRRGGRRYCS